MTSLTTIHRIPDKPVSRSPEHGWTLPARLYTDTSVFTQETAAIFYRNWWYAGHASQLAEPGNYLTLRILGQSILIGMDKHGKINAFYNVCQHRGHELLQGNGNTRVITCPYHAWAYDFEGNLVSARNTESVAGFQHCDFALRPVRVECFCQMIFVNLDPEATPLSNLTGDLEQEIQTYCPSVNELTFAQRDEFELACNWKVAIDNFLECYHCDPAHKDLVDLMDMSSYQTTTHRYYSSHIAKEARHTNSSAYQFETGDVDFGYAAWYLWPNLTIWAYPGDANLSVLQMLPVEPGLTVEYQDWYVAADGPSDQLKEAMRYQKEVLQPEDIGLCESVQRGLGSNGYNQGRLIVDAARSALSEHGVHHFHMLVAEALGIPTCE